MIFAESDFTNNFLSAVGYGDSVMEENISIDELARIIVEDKRAVVNLLRKNNVNATINQNNKQIRVLVTSEIEKNNDAFLSDLSKLIVSKNFSNSKAKNFINKHKEKFKKAEGDEPTATSKIWSFLTTALKDEKIQDAASTLVSNSLTNAFNKTNPDSTSNQALLDQRLLINELQARQQKKMSTGAKIAIIAGSLLVVGTIIFLITRSKSPAPAPAV